MPSTSDLRIPALSVSRPWPRLIFHAGKPLENRTWNTHYRGDLLIHASGKWDGRGIPFAGSLTAQGVRGIPLHELSGNHDLHPAKEIIGVVELHGICTDARKGGECGCGPWAFPGQNHWLMRNRVLFPRPVPHRGSLTLWQVSDDAWPAVETQLKEVGRV